MNELQQIAWLPVLSEPPAPFVPWDAALYTAPVAVPSGLRPRDDMWLASASCRILDGGVRSTAYARSSAGRRLRTFTSLPLSLERSPLSRAKRRRVGRRIQTQHGRCRADALQGARQRSQRRRQFREGAAVLAALSEQPCIWSGESFVLPASTAMRSPLNLAPHLHTVPAGLQVFAGLLSKLGVRPHIEAGQYLQLLETLATASDNAPLARDSLQLVLAVVQQLASPQHQPLPPGTVHLPDRAGVLAPAHELMYDDAPWLSDGSLTMPGTPSAASMPAAPVPSARSRRVHLDVAHEVAQRLGAQSLRGWLVSRNADTLTLGQENVEAFGQHESLTSRLHNILELYADGVGILHELIQNADDAGATRVAFLLDESHHGDASLLSPAMRTWQGPSLFCYNDAVFTPQDFKNICSIGSNSKLSSASAIGRFGLGFNAVYHFTDVPSFVSGEHVVFFDPHAESLPGATPKQPRPKDQICGSRLS